MTSTRQGCVKHNDAMRTLSTELLFIKVFSQPEVISRPPPKKRKKVSVERWARGAHALISVQNIGSVFPHLHVVF